MIQLDKNINRIISHCKGKKVLILTTSNRWSGSEEEPKSTKLARSISEKIENSLLIDVSKLNIFSCEGNVSSSTGNTCGLKDSGLKDKLKNPSGNHRCWASINNEDDELWKISKPLLEADVVLFFVSVRWGSANAVYQKLIERLNWIENRWTTLNEDNVVSNIEAGVITIGHNWNSEDVMLHQKQVLNFYGFKVPQELSFSYQWTSDVNDETNKNYINDAKDFETKFSILNKINESFKNFLKL